MEMAYGREDQEIQTSMKVSTKTIKKMGMEFLSGQMVTYTKVILNLMRNTVMERCIGLMVNPIKANGNMIIK